MNTQKSKRKMYAKFALKILAGSSVLYVAGLFNPRSSLKLIKVFKKFSSHELVQLRRALRNLERRRLIVITEKGEEAEIRLTPNGKREILRSRLRDISISIPPQWDGKWHLVLFDIPEYLKVGRDALRNSLNRIGFYQVQKSVYLYPYPCEKEIEDIAHTFEFENYVHCFTVEQFKPSYHTHLCRYFGLKDKS